MTTDAQNWQGKAVVAAQERQPWAQRSNLRCLIKRARGFLDADNGGNLGQPGDGLRLDVRASPARDVVNDNRQVTDLGQCIEVSIVAFLGWLVVIRAHNQRGVR